MKKIIFSKEEKEKICKLFESGTIIKEIAKIVKGSETLIRKNLIAIFGLEKYTPIAKTHLRENGQKNGHKNL